MADIEETQQVSEDDIEAGKEEEQETPESVAEQTPKAEQAEENRKPGQARSEIKVIIIMKADRIMVGVQSPGCDPVYQTSQGTLADALQLVPVLVAEANLKWDANPTYPKADLPAPPPSTAPARTPVAAAPAKPKAQPSFF
jgi:hypothetical protein